MSQPDKQLDEIRKAIQQFPASPGLYFMKDASDKVLYIGKAKNLRSRAASYFQPAADLMATRGPMIVEMIAKTTHVDYLETTTEVDAILQEARLIKDIHPPYNTDLTDGKSFPYLEITTSDNFPGVYITRSPREKGTRLFGPFTSVNDLRNTLVVLQKIFKFRTCKLDIKTSDDKRKFFRPCLLHNINQCAAPCADRITRSDYKKIISDLLRFLKSKRSIVLKKMKTQMAQASENLEYEKAAMYRDRIKLIEKLDQRGTPETNVQPEVFARDPAMAMAKLQKVIDRDDDVRVIEGIDIAHLSGGEAVGSVVQFIDGKPFKNGYRRFKIKEVDQIDDFAMIAEVVRRRYKHAAAGQELWPDVILIDGGIGQLHAAQHQLDILKKDSPSQSQQHVTLLSLAKREELIYKQGLDQPIKLSRQNLALKLLQYVRDESHRFAQHYHHLLRNKKLLDQ